MHLIRILTFSPAKYSPNLGAAIIVILLFLSGSISMAGSPPRKVEVFAALAPSDKPEYSEPMANGTIDDEDDQSDIEEPTADPQGEAAGMRPDAGAEKKSPAPASRQENGQKPEQNAERPAPGKENRNTGDSRITDLPSGSQPAAGPPPDKPAPAASIQQAKGSDSLWIIGGESVYVVKKHESLRMVGAKTGTDWLLLAKENRLDPAKKLEPGQKILVNNRKIIPKFVKDGIVINIPDRTLYFFRDNRLAKALPVAVGRRQHDRNTDWRTPTGKFRIVAKQKNPAWLIPPSIIKEMEKSGKTVKSDIVPPGGRNPLGKYALRTSISGVMIHSTTHPESVYGYSSHGCIRMLPGNIEELYNEVQTRTTGEIIYQPVKMAVTTDGRVFLEVHPDSYDRHKNLEAEVKRLVAANDAKSSVDWNKIKASLKLKSGKAEDITLEKDTPQNMQAARQAMLPTP